MTDIQKLRVVLDLFDVEWVERKTSIISCGRKYSYDEKGEIVKVTELDHKGRE